MMKRVRALVAITVALMLLSTSLSVQNAKADQASITPLDDSYVKSDEANANKGNSSSLYTYKREYEFNEHVRSTVYQTWLKFNLSQIPSEATIFSITLRLHSSLLSSNTTNSVGLFFCDNNSWTESGITWSNLPQVSTKQLVQAINVSAPDSYYDFDLTSTVKGKLIVSLILETLESTGPLQWAVFDSKEGTFAPTLIVEYAVQFHASPPDPAFMVFIAVVTATIVVFLAILALLKYRTSAKKGTEKKQLRILHEPRLSPTQKLKQSAIRQNADSAVS